MINYIIPGFYELSNFNLIFLNIKQEYPEYFYPDINIEATYGNPQFCIWDGGRIFTHYRYTTKEEVEFLINEYKKFNLNIRYVFTSSILSENKYLYNDRFCNLLMALGENKNCEVVSADDNFTIFLKEKYPSYSFISSTTKCLKENEEIHNELLKDLYKMHCLDYNLNKNFNFLNSLTEKEREKTEFLVNAICPLNCKNRKYHYLLNSIDHLNYAKGYNMDCPIQHMGVHPNIRKNHISYEDIKNIYEPMGFSHFKIEGRTLTPSEVLGSYCHYMVKPEYHDWMFVKIFGETYEKNY